MEYDCGIERTLSFEESTGSSSFDYDSADEFSSNKNAPSRETKNRGTTTPVPIKSPSAKEKLRRFAARSRGGVNE